MVGDIETWAVYCIARSFPLGGMVGCERPIVDVIWWWNGTCTV